jgi:hypothetical protein
MFLDGAWYPSSFPRFVIDPTLMLASLPNVAAQFFLNSNEVEIRHSSN